MNPLFSIANLSLTTSPTVNTSGPNQKISDKNSQFLEFYFEDSQPDLASELLDENNSIKNSIVVSSELLKKLLDKSSVIRLLSNSQEEKEVITFREISFPTFALILNYLADEEFSKSLPEKEFQDLWLLKKGADLLDIKELSILCNDIFWPKIKKLLETTNPNKLLENPYASFRDFFKNIMLFVDYEEIQYKIKSWMFNQKNEDYVKTFLDILEGIPLCSIELSNVNYLKLISEKQPRIESLSLYNYKKEFLERERVNLNSISELKNLKSLTVYGCDALSNDLLNPILSSLPNLQILNIERCEGITDRIGPYLPISLKSLKLTGCLVTDQIGESLKKLTNLSYLNLSNCFRLSDKIGQDIAELKNLKSLSLSSCKLLTNEITKYISCLVSLNHLNLSFCERLTAFDNIRELKGLRSLNFIGSSVTPKILEDIADLPKISSVAFSFLPKLTENTLSLGKKIHSLKFVNIDPNPFSYKESEYKDCLLQFPNLESLKLLTHSSLPNDFLVYLKDLKHLKSLTCSSVFFDQEIGKLLADLSQLEYLDISATSNLTDNWETIVEELGKLKNLKSLGIPYPCKFKESNPLTLQLQHLTIKNAYAMFSENFPSISESIENLIHLNSLTLGCSFTNNLINALLNLMQEKEQLPLIKLMDVRPKDLKDSLQSLDHFTRICFLANGFPISD